ncbi:MAG: vitamin B12 dependent-methionine synthase activation domain-containing protein [Bacteroidales bacterium]
MKGATFQFGFSDLGLTVRQIEHVLGYREGESEETISELIEVLLRESETFVNVKAEYVIFNEVKFNNQDKTIEVSNCVFDIKKIVFNQIRKSESIAIFLCTAGKEIGTRSRTAMADGDLLTGYVYDVIGSEIVEAASDLMQNSLQLSVACEGKKITNRYSPGYCGWNVEEQHKLFQLMPDNYCGISLTPSALMDPMKSISGFIGIGADVRYNAYTCNLCDMKDCIYRKKKEKI